MYLDGWYTRTEGVYPPLAFRMSFPVLQVVSIYPSMFVVCLFVYLFVFPATTSLPCSSCHAMSGFLAQSCEVVENSQAQERLLHVRAWDDSYAIPIEKTFWSWPDALPDIVLDTCSWFLRIPMQGWIGIKMLGQDGWCVVQWVRRSLSAKGNPIFQWLSGSSAVMATRYDLELMSWTEFAYQQINKLISWF